jgi:hypothetical protein
LTVKSAVSIEEIKRYCVWPQVFKEEDSHVAGEIKRLQDIFRCNIAPGSREYPPTVFEPTRKVMQRAKEFVEEKTS